MFTGCAKITQLLDTFKYRQLNSIQLVIVINFVTRDLILATGSVRKYPVCDLVNYLLCMRELGKKFTQISNFGLMAYTKFHVHCVLNYYVHTLRDRQYDRPPVDVFQKFTLTYNFGLMSIPEI